MFNLLFSEKINNDIVSTSNLKFTPFFLAEPRRTQRAQSFYSKMHCFTPIFFVVQR